MSGTILGGKKAAKTNIKRHGKDFYREIGRRGGINGHTGGFAANPALARLAGSKGGKKSKRGANSVRVQKIEPNKEKIEKLYQRGYTIPQIANEIGVPYSSLLSWVKENIPGYGTKYNIY